MGDTHLSVPPLIMLRPPSRLVPPLPLPLPVLLLLMMIRASSILADRCGLVRKKFNRLRIGHGKLNQVEKSKEVTGTSLFNMFHLLRLLFSSLPLLSALFWLLFVSL